MRLKVVLNTLGIILKYIGALMLIPALVGFYYSWQDPAQFPSVMVFIYSFLVTTSVGLTLEYTNRSSDDFRNRESFGIVAFAWLLAAIFGALPFLLSGMHPVDALFESMSGFTTTGATIMTDIESHSKALLFWRCFMQWLGGMGIIMLFLAILPKLGIAGRQLFRAEAPGPTEDKLKPRLKETAKILWMVYVVISAVEFIALWLAGMGVYDSLTHTFTTMACGGFSPRADSIAAFNSPLIEGIIVFFMFVAGANFALHYRLIYVDHRSLLKDGEFKFYSFIVVSSAAALTWTLWRTGTFEGIGTSFRYAIFQVLSIITTTGYATHDFNTWPDSSRMVLVILMFIGGCAGSTAGGIKVVRLLLMLKYAYRELFRSLQPKLVRPIRLGERVVPEDVMNSIFSFIILYVLVFMTSTFILSELGVGAISAASASIVTLGNIGPGFDLVGPWSNFSTIPDMGKLVLIGNMWIGRLEIFTVLVLLIPGFWKE
ncbi:MAG: TrkH family potassium uptake protein [ANME-2 cluster archaeon]|nr:TrkH family potassium uptake protein [ANME-2 cluster archaeon]MBC2700989.1 TrkH family potassium uptake protein [ANME-2 cluster archaeon]MBC2706292.1 TrkH family potassium uptake protein [ANME-2 cluster archaeon]MBC2745707.1 TrkH family potassium uptake protein [ANME-2 cluster archaeon]